MAASLRAGGDPLPIAMVPSLAHDVTSLGALREIAEILVAEVGRPGKVTPLRKGTL